MPYGGRSTFGYGNPFGPSRFDRAAGAQPFNSNYNTPGWQRAQQSWSSGRDTKKRTRTPVTLDGELVAASTANVPAFKSGTRVRHEKFGDGTVTFVDGNKLTINFDDGSTKRVVASFVDPI
jgi:DNA helicase-2/ATP-dependent DNA helicase PcrA